ncbi:hypothetical protein [Streptomyces sp. NPDC002215]|uniref:hypothetical protein n=1 Tax=Streptomyces sp. NPDC002215 TaxID=3154412 RepID=UPI003332680B
MRVAPGRFDINANLHGLPAAFFWAGSSAVADCLWPVAPYAAAKRFGTLCEQPAFTSDRRTVDLSDGKARSDDI